MSCKGISLALAVLLVMSASAQAEDQRIESSGDLGLPQEQPSGQSMMQSPPQEQPYVEPKQLMPEQSVNTPVQFQQLQPAAGQVTEPQPADEPVAPVADDNYKHFEAWLDEFRAEAMSKGIKKSVLDDAFNDLDEPSESVIEKDQTQPEVKQTWPGYLKNVVTDKKIKLAREAYRKNKALLLRIEDQFGVQPQVVVALWGLESGFGEHQGSHSIIESLATLAYDGRRAAFFRAELLNALTIMQQEHIRSAELLGSWAGAMGQTQFMPSSFLKFAVDFDGDGKKDIWSSDADALASIANYLHQKGWDDNAEWGTPVSLPQDTTMDWPTMKEHFPLSTWKKFGVRQKDGTILEGVSKDARLVLLDGDVNQAYLVYSNYDVIMDWNRSVYFATSVNMLADAIGDDQ